MLLCNIDSPVSMHIPCVQVCIPVELMIPHRPNRSIECCALMSGTVNSSPWKREAVYM